MATSTDIQNVNKAVKSIDVKGRPYVTVNERIKAFRTLYPTGFITTEILSLEDGVVTMKATVGYYEDGEKVILGTGHAQEKESSSYINKTSFIENCVPLDAQILTPDGWKYYFQVHPSDVIIGFDMEDKTVKLGTLQRVNVYHDIPILDLSTKRFHAKCTPDHKWIVKNQKGDIYKRATQDLKTSDKIVQNVYQDVEPSEIGRKLGWLLCDCEINVTAGGLPSTGYINQSKHVDDITELFGEGRKTKKYCDQWMDNYEWVIPAETVREILGYFRIATYKDLLPAMMKADISDVAGCFRSMILADGEKRGFSSTYYELVEAVQAMAARLGISTTFITSRMQKKSTRPVYTLGIKNTDGAYFSEMKVKQLPPMDVWCPTTSLGTWFMRQGTFVTLTSNCETSAWGRAMSACGLGIDASIASYEEVINAINNQEKATPEQVRYILDNLDENALRRAVEKYGDIEDMPLDAAEKTILSINKKKARFIHEEN